VPNPDHAAKMKAGDPYLFAGHEIVNVLVFLFVLGLPHAGPDFLVQD
jgi:hypothetical protein